MLISAIGSIGERLDSKFITAYFFPAFIAVLGTLWVAVTALGGERFAERVAGLDSVEQAIFTGILLLITMMVAYMLRSLGRPIAQLFAGHTFPRVVKDKSVRSQLRARSRARLSSAMISRNERLVPVDPTDTAPTALGNVLAAAADYRVTSMAWMPITGGRGCCHCCPRSSRSCCNRWKPRCDRC
jgi:hypothetical protein